MKGDKSYISKFLLPVISWVLLLFFSSCCFLQISKGPIPEDDLKCYQIAKQSWRMKNHLGDTRAIGIQDWDGDTLAVLVNAVDETVWMGPPIIPLIPVFYGYGHKANSKGQIGEFSRTDRLWITAMLILAPGHSIHIDPCASEWVDKNEKIHAIGMASRFSPIYMGIDDHIPLSYMCETPIGNMIWTNNDQRPKCIFLMICFEKGIQLNKDAKWSLKLPCIVNGTERTAEFKFKYKRRVKYTPLVSPNG